jgi:hypothetical protein
VVDCRGERHRLGLVDGALTALDHDPAQLRREELLAELGGMPLPCLQAVDRAHRSPECLDEVRGRLDHGDFAGARAVLTALIGVGAVLPPGALRDELRAIARRRIDHGLYRAGIPTSAARPLPGQVGRRDPRRRDLRSHPRHGTAR